MVETRTDLRSIVEQQLSERVARKGSRDGGHPLTTVHCQAINNLQLRSTVEGHEFISDERLGGGGYDAGPAPLRYFLGGIMMCHHVWCIKQAVVRGIQLKRLEGDISGYAGPIGSGFDRLTYRVDLDASVGSDLIWEVVDSAATTCPAFTTVARSTPIALTLIHNGSLVLEHEYGGATSNG